LAYAHCLLIWLDKKILDGRLVFDRQNACHERFKNLRLEPLTPVLMHP
jgi:hypothetical protein